MLLERDTHEDALQRSIDALIAGGGCGLTLAIEGSAGVGKTTLLRRAEERGSAAGVNVLSIHGAAALGRGLTARLRRAAGDGRPLLVSADDADRLGCDRLRALAASIHEVENQDVALVVVVRPGFSATLAETFGPVTTCHVEPLSPNGTAHLVRVTLTAAGDIFVAEVHALTAGRPAFIEHLVNACVVDGLTGANEDAVLLDAIAAAALSRLVIGELGRLGEPATLLAQALAVLADHAELHLAATLAELDDIVVRRAADDLFAAGFVTSTQPSLQPRPVGPAILRGLAPGIAAPLHAAAARELVARGEIDTAASHLWHVDPRGDPQVATILHTAATAALNAPERAAIHLERALREPPPAGLRAAVLRDLGRAELALGRPSARPHLEAAAELNPRDHDIARWLARAHLNAGDADAALAALDHALRNNGTHDDLRHRLEAERAAIGLMHPTHWPATQEHLEALGPPPPGGPGARQLAAIQAFNAYRKADPVAIVRQYTLRSLIDGRADAELLAALAPLTMVITTLLACDELDLARRLAHDGQQAAARRGDRVAATVMAWYAARIAYAGGDLRAAQASIVTLHDPTLAQWVLPVAQSQQALTWVALGEPDRAHALLATIDTASISGHLAYECVLRARGTVLLARGEHVAAASAFEAGRDLMAWYGIINPAGCHHASGGALALAQAGDRDLARDLAHTELSIAQQFGAPGTTGRALWVTARIDNDLHGLATAADLLGQAAAFGARAAALGDLGDALLTNGRDDDARSAYYEMLDLADRGGANPLASRALEGLHRTGARPRRARLRGADALTTAERRTAELASSGLSNADIAAALFISVKTVEGHLRGTYRKLEIHSRRDLAAALETA